MLLQGLIIVHLIVQLTVLTLRDGVKIASRGRGVVYILLKCSKHVCILASILSLGHDCTEKDVYIYLHIYFFRHHFYFKTFFSRLWSDHQTPFVPKRLLFKDGHDEVARRHTSSAPQTLSGVPQM